MGTQGNTQRDPGINQLGFHLHSRKGQARITVPGTHGVKTYLLGEVYNVCTSQADAKWEKPKA